MIRKAFSWILLVTFVACAPKQDSTPDNISIVQLRELSEMATVEYVISKIVKASGDTPWYKYGEKKILMSCRATLKAGIDMDRIRAEDIQIQGTSVRMELPRARLISLNVHPESIKEEYVKSDFFRSPFTNQERYMFLAQAEEEIRASVSNMGLLGAAEANTVVFFESWLRLMGFENIQIIFKETVEQSKPNLIN